MYAFTCLPCGVSGSVFGASFGTGAGGGPPCVTTCALERQRDEQQQRSHLSLLEPITGTVLEPPEAKLRSRKLQTANRQLRTHSSRNATTGSIRDARSAGGRLASMAAAAIAPAIATMVAGSPGRTPNSSVVSRRDSPMADAGAHDQPGRDQRRALAEDQPEHAPASRAERHAHAELAHAPAHRERQQPIHADERQHRREQRESRQERRQEARLRHALIQQPLHRHDVRQRQRRVDLLHGGAQCRRWPAPDRRPSAARRRPAAR